MQVTPVNINDPLVFVFSVYSEFLLGALLKLEGFPNTTRREKVKAIFPEKSIRFIDMEIGDISCVVMFLAENGTTDSMKDIQTEDNTLKFDDTIIKYTILDGETEQNEWVRLSQSINDNINKNKKKKNSKRGGRRGRDSRKFQSWRDGKDDRVHLGKRKSHEDNVTTDDTEQSQSKHIRMADSDED